MTKKPAPTHVVPANGPGRDPFPAPAPVVPVHGRLIPANGTPVAGCPTNLDLATEEGRRALLAALGEGDVTVADLNGLAFLTSHYLVTPGESVDPETGEVSNYPRLVLISPEGKTLVTTSIVVPHRLAAVLDLWGPGPWDPPLPLLVMERRGRRTGRTYHELRMGARAEGGAR